MELIRINQADTDAMAPLVAAFRVQLKSYKGIQAQPNTAAGKKGLHRFEYARDPKALPGRKADNNRSG